ncbi:hypothetical protein C0991_001618 [Blastosporella zonata]|nr:hypothetical protein C0991_001618 [Blastosporella zonata]
MRLKAIQIGLTSTQSKDLMTHDIPSIPTKPSHSQGRQSNLILSPTPNLQTRLEDIQLGLTPSKGSNIVSSSKTKTSLAIGRPSPMPTQIVSQPNETSAALASNSVSGFLDGKEDTGTDPSGRMTSPPPGSYEDVETMRSGKNSQETVVGPSRIIWRDDDVENPFDQSTSLSQVSNSTTKSHPYVSALSPSIPAPPSPFSETISTMIRHLEGIPPYVETLERKFLASERSNEAKTKRITELEVEIERLQEENTQLRGSSDSSSLQN